MPSTIIVDAMGGDSPRELTVEASLEVCRENPSINVILVGSEKDILNCIDEKIPQNIDIVNAKSIITMDEKPSKALRNKSDSSIHKGMELLVEGRGDAFFSAGNTGAVVTVSYFTSGVMESVSRPALATIYPSVDLKKLIILDLGATLEPKPENLVDFAVLGEAYRYCITGLEDSRISILNVGEEDNKGSKVVVEASRLLKKTTLNYTGFIEGNRLFTSPDADFLQ